MNETYMIDKYELMYGGSSFHLICESTGAELGGTVMGLKILKKYFLNLF